MATINLGRIKPVNKGTWSNSTAYAIDDFVQYTDNGVLSTYIAVATSTNQAPSTSGTENSTYWKYMSKGVSIGVGNNKIVTTDASGNPTGLSIGTSGQALKVNSSANGFEFGDAGKIKAFSRFALTGLSTLSATSSEYYFWTVTYNRQTNGDLWIVSDIPASELPNGPYVAPHLKIVAGSTTVRGARGLKWFRPNNDNTELGFNSYFTASELGSTTGNITISHGWNWGGATTTTLPITYINLGGTTGSGNQQTDARVPNAGNTEGHMMVMEF